MLLLVIHGEKRREKQPAKAGIRPLISLSDEMPDPGLEQAFGRYCAAIAATAKNWIPTFAGMTVVFDDS